MKHVSTFAKFLAETVNLNKARYDVAVKSVETITGFLKNHEELKALFVRTSPQGSFRQKTIIRPATEDDEFDVDLLFEMKAVANWTARDYLEHVAKQFKDSGRYQDKVDTRGKSRCVTIDYESDFHVDIVPSVQLSGRMCIMNRKDNKFEETDGDGYAQWFASRDTITRGHLVPVVRLIKYLRDIKSIFEVKSVLLTTLLGNQVRDQDATLFSDIPSALVQLMSRLDNFLQTTQQMPRVNNPVLASENFNRHWNQEKYEVFRSSVHELSGKMNTAFNEANESSSLEQWQDIFGSEFPGNEPQDSSALTASAATYPLADFSHQQPPTWPADIRSRAHIEGYLYSQGGTQRFRGIGSDAKVVSGLALKFVCRTTVPQPYEVFWQVVNTGKHAWVQSGLRGEFFKAKNLEGHILANPLVNWEKTEYTGKHWIESFIVKDHKLVARSGRFYVNVRNPKFN